MFAINRGLKNPEGPPVTGISQHREKILRDKAVKFGVQIAELVNMGNHLHIRLRMRSRSGFQKFLKSITILIARIVTGARRGHKFGRFWKGLAFTRVLTSSLELLRLKGYFEGNRRQADHGYKARERHLQQFNRWVRQMRMTSTG